MSLSEFTILDWCAVFFSLGLGIGFGARVAAYALKPDQKSLENTK